MFDITLTVYFENYQYFHISELSSKFLVDGNENMEIDDEFYDDYDRSEDSAEDFIDDIFDVEDNIGLRLVNSFQ